MVLVLLKLLGALAVAAFMVGAMWALRKSFRRIRGRRLGERGRRELAAFAQRLDRRTLLPVLGSLSVSVVVVTVVLDHVAAAWAWRHPTTRYVLDPVTQRATWLKWAMPHGFVFGFVAAEWLTWRWMIWRFGQWTTAKYRLAGNYRYRMDYARAFWVCLALLAAACLPLGALQADWYARIDEKYFVVNELCGLGETSYRYDQIDKIVLTAHLYTKTGEVITRDRLFIMFTDDYQWFLDPPLDYGEWLKFVCAKSGKPITRASFIEDVVRP